MSDLNKFMNAYVDHAVGMIHEHIATILQLKAQLKVANDLIAEKDGVIASLSSQLETTVNSNKDMVALVDKARQWEESYNSMAQKVTHLDTALAQIASMKSEIQARDRTIAELTDKLNPPKKKLNIKKIGFVEEPTPEKIPENDF